MQICRCASENKSIAINQPLFLCFLGHHLLIQGGWNKQREHTECSSGTDSAHHPGTAANITENIGFVQKTLVLYRKPLLSMQTPSEILELSPLALTGAPSQAFVIKILQQKGKNP